MLETGPRRILEHRAYGALRREDSMQHAACRTRQHAAAQWTREQWTARLGLGRGTRRLSDKTEYALLITLC